MKCQYCGGEVSSQSIKCPYCNQDNPEGIAFQKEVYKRIERNKLLKPFLLKQKTPELVQKMLTRVIIIAIVVNILLFVLLVVMVALSDTDIFPLTRKGEHAKEFAEEFWGNGDYYYKEFCLEMYEFIDSVEEGHMPDRYCLSGVVTHAYYVVSNMEELDEQTCQTMQMTLDAFFRGYIGLSDEEMEFLESDKEKRYPYGMEDYVEEAAVRAIKEKLEGRVK